jgi:hypothetical protein
MRIPEVRDRLYRLADAVEDQDLSTELRFLADQLWRRRSQRSLTADQRIESDHMTPELASRIRRYAKQHPTMTMLAIGREFNVNQGRVSEALYGKRW